MRDFSQFDSSRRFKGKRGKMEIVTYADGKEVERFTDVHGAFLVTIEEEGGDIKSTCALLGPENIMQHIVFASMQGVSQAMERLPKGMLEEVLQHMTEHILDGHPELEEPLAKAFPVTAKSKKKSHGLNLKVVEDTGKPKRTRGPSASDFLYRKED